MLVATSLQAADCAKSWGMRADALRFKEARACGRDAVRRAGPYRAADEAEHDAYSNSTEPSVSPVVPRILRACPNPYGTV